MTASHGIYYVVVALTLGWAMECVLWAIGV